MSVYFQTCEYCRAETHVCIGPTPTKKHHLMPQRPTHSCLSVKLTSIGCPHSYRDPVDARVHTPYAPPPTPLFLHNTAFECRGVRMSNDLWTTAGQIPTGIYRTSLTVTPPSPYINHISNLNPNSNPNINPNPKANMKTRSEYRK